MISTTRRWGVHLIRWTDDKKSCTPTFFGPTAGGAAAFAHDEVLGRPSLGVKLVSAHNGPTVRTPAIARRS